MFWLLLLWVLDCKAPWEGMCLTTERCLNSPCSTPWSQHSTLDVPVCNGYAEQYFQHNVLSLFSILSFSWKASRKKNVHIIIPFLPLGQFFPSPASAVLALQLQIIYCLIKPKHLILATPASLALSAGNTVNWGTAARKHTRLVEAVCVVF